MENHIFLAASMTRFIPAEFKIGIGFFIIVLMFFCYIFGVIRIMSGAAQLDHGEEGKMSIFTGLMLASSVFLMQGAYAAMGLPELDFQAMGITVPQQVADIIWYSLVAIILVGFAWGAIRIVGGIREMRQDGQGKVKIFSGIIMAASPWFMYGIYAATGLGTLGGQSMMPQF